MERSVVSISRTLGSGGEEIGRLISQELGYSYVDDEIIVNAAEKAGVSPETVEELEHSQSRLAQILGAMDTEPYRGLLSSAPPNFWSDSPVIYRDWIERVIRNTARRGQVVIVAHGSSIPLAGMSGLLRVLVTASLDTRVERLTGTDDHDEQQAQKAIEDSDRERARFFRRFYNLEEELPTHYDIVVNTDVLTVEEAAKVVISVAKG